ncbi:MAG: ASKHA domain-containing protein, partial [Terracidiphilus sp.]
IQLEPLSVEAELLRGTSLASTLQELGVEFPCGGTGLCGSCRVRVLEGALPITALDRSAFSADELVSGWRLACQAYAETPLVLQCGQWRMDVLTDNSSLSGAGKRGLGIAIDLGTTTIAAQIIEMATGSVLGVDTDLNPQASFGSDVMSRICAALQGADLTTVVRLALRQMIAKLASGREEEIVEVVLVGNTVMHHLFAGLDVEPLSCAPFDSPHLSAQYFRPRELGWPLPPGCDIRFERCLGGFVGSDILAGILAVGMTRSQDLLALVDLGTNGEIAVGNRDGVVCASTAAGPAFEAGSIRMGMRAATGAISHVSLFHGKTRATVIGDVEARGICGSGLVDAVALGLKSGAILASGRITSPTKLFPVKAPIILYQSDIRELQLAKAAIAFGFKLLLRRVGASADSLKNIYLAGAFGNYVQADSAVAIGLIEAPIKRIRASGNTALHGAKILLLSAGEPALPNIEHVSLAADPGFQDGFADCIAFPPMSPDRSA